VDLVLNRQSGGAVRDQLLAQLEIKILTGHFAPGERLPSVRALARRLKLHPNTVSAAYQDLERAGHVRLKRGAGVFVRPGAPVALHQARDLDEMIRIALYTAFQKGYRGSEIRAAVERWLRAAPPERVLAVDPCAEMAELMAFEIQETVGVPADGCSIETLRREPERADGCLVAALPYHLETIARILPGATPETLHIEAGECHQKVLRELPAGATVVFVSHSPTVLPFTSMLTRSLRGDEVLVLTFPLVASREWRRALPAADIVFADGMAIKAVRRLSPRRLCEVRILRPAVLDRLREALAMVVVPPRGAAS
jgi:GntR family transcriptional regulator